MKYDFHVHDAIRVEYRVATDGPSFPRGYAAIESETRGVGGNGALAALALARWGARVLLTGNAIGEDEHGRFLRSELADVPGLDFEPEVRSDLETPYAILLRAGGYEVGTLLSRTAAPLLLPVAPETQARFRFGEKASWSGTGDAIELEASSQEYGSLLGTLGAVAAFYLQLMGSPWPAHLKEQFLSAVPEIFDRSFSGAAGIPSLEELEARLAVSNVPST